MKKKITYSIIASALLLSLSGCSQKYTDAPEKVKVNQTIQDIKNEQTKSYNRSFNIQVGDNINTIFERLSHIDGKIYILENNSNCTSKIKVNNIENLFELGKFFEANKYLLITKEIEGTKYVNVKVKPQVSEAENRLKNIKVELNGNVLVGDIINSITSDAKINPIWDDKSSNDLSMVTKSFNFKGNGLQALNHIVNSLDLSLDFKDNQAIISYFKTETMSIDIFTRDRVAEGDITIAMKNSPSSSTTSETTGSEESSGDGKELELKYTTKIVEDLKESLKSVLSKEGSFSLLSTSGQILVKDKTSNVKMAQKVISDFNSKFKDTVELKLTLYKLTREKSDTRNIDFSSIANKWNFSASGSALGTGNGIIGGGSGALSIGFNDGNVNSVLHFLREYGDTEVVNPMIFETQTNLLKTVKIANNYGYVSSITSTTDGGGGMSGTVNPSSVADGGFVSTLTKVIDNDTIAVDLFTSQTNLSKFNTTIAFGTTVQTPDTAEQSIDGYHRVKVGVPYILVSHKLEESQNSGSGLPFKFLDSLKSKFDKKKDTYIILALEARIKK